MATAQRFTTQPAPSVPKNGPAQWLAQSVAGTLEGINTPTKQEAMLTTAFPNLVNMGMVSPAPKAIPGQTFNYGGLPWTINQGIANVKNQQALANLQYKKAQTANILAGLPQPVSIQTLMNAYKLASQGITSTFDLGGGRTMKIGLSQLEKLMLNPSFKSAMYSGNEQRVKSMFNEFVTSTYGGNNSVAPTKHTRADIRNYLIDNHLDASPKNVEKVYKRLPPEQRG